ncbi:hypothetical protein D9758_016673 [Tetrapyrgos nigripes]|uniref:Peptidase C14 caspase domain-containing protein n=1 Tax=Tetrapyrgos nigripes TaxID=182062 RepID=A0A8H5FI89_9AGAR|nr:hypothetical protein D9758_016673 [Tetrapyrgos nigripes]
MSDMLNVLTTLSSLRKEIVRAIDRSCDNLHLNSISSFRALIIGINEYLDQSIHDLRCCVVDAYAVKQYLSSNGIGEEHIKVLCDESASCSRIEEEIRVIAESGNPILIYFAGHGATGTFLSKSKLSLRPKTTEVKMLLPHDFSRDGLGHGIPVQILSCLLPKNSVILTDCSYPRLHNPSFVELGRGISLTDTSRVTGDMYLSLKQKNTHLILRLFSWFIYPFRLLTSWRPNPSSCIFMSACKDGELAMETAHHGVFTEGLLRRLWCGNTKQLSYEKLSLLISSERQHAQCEGLFKSSPLPFDGKSRSVDFEREHCFVLPSSTPGECFLSVGHALGISPGLEFDLFADTAHGEKIGRLVVCETSAFGSVAKLGPSELGVTRSDLVLGYALKAPDGTRGGLRVLLPSMPSLRDQIRDLTNPEIVLVDDCGGNPDLVVACDNDRQLAHLELFHPALGGGFKLPFSVSTSLDTLLYVLRSAEAFIWRIRTTPSRHGAIASDVLLECRRLAQNETKADFFESDWVPENTTNLINENGLLNAEVGQKYGFLITNRSSVNIFCAVVSFDLSDWSISPFYQTRYNEPIPPGGSLTFGYGQNFRDRPVTYFLREGQKVDHAFLKVFISTENVDYFDLTQPSALGDAHAPRHPEELSSKSRKMTFNYILVHTVQR